MMGNTHFTHFFFSVFTSILAHAKSFSSVLPRDIDFHSPIELPNYTVIKQIACKKTPKKFFLGVLTLYNSDLSCGKTAYLWRLKCSRIALRQFNRCLITSGQTDFACDVANSARNFINSAAFLFLSPAFKRRSV